ncbi:hypothetical protein IMZ48_18985 [Candidatus Bathyarchaeota archaeon]|nr:hypothetical protein [Candidatus Bathyarchaeota archaeon]
MPHLQKCASTSAEETGWCGITHDGKMTGGLLLVAWPSADQVLTSFRMADGYAMPGVYSGSSTLTQISSSVTDTGYEVVFRCEGCLAWTDAAGAPATAGTSEGNFMLGYAQGKDTPVNAACPDEIELEYHTLGFNLWSATTEGLVVEDYEGVAELATEVVEGDCDAVPAPSGPAEPSGSAAPSGTAPAGTAPSAV